MRVCGVAGVLLQVSEVGGKIPVDRKIEKTAWPPYMRRLLMPYCRPQNWKITGAGLWITYLGIYKLEACTVESIMEVAIPGTRD